MTNNEIDFTKVGENITAANSQIKMKKHYEANRSYWEWLENKKGNHFVVKNMLWKMQELSGEFLILPRFLDLFFFLYLNKKKPNQQNKQIALNLTRVYSLLCHQYYKSATTFNMITSFYVSPSVWDKFLIGRKAKDKSISILKEMGLIVAYRYNRNKFAPSDNSRFVIMYQFNLEKIKWIHYCVKSIHYLEENKKETKYEEVDNSYNFDNVIEMAERLEENDEYNKMQENFNSSRRA